MAEIIVDHMWPSPKSIKFSADLDAEPKFHEKLELLLSFRLIRSLHKADCPVATKNKTLLHVNDCIINHIRQTNSMYIIHDNYLNL